MKSRLQEPLASQNRQKPRQNAPGMLRTAWTIHLSSGLFRAIVGPFCVGWRNGLLRGQGIRKAAMGFSRDPWASPSFPPFPPFPSSFSPCCFRPKFPSPRRMPLPALRGLRTIHLSSGLFRAILGHYRGVYGCPAVMTRHLNSLPSCRRGRKGCRGCFWTHPPS